MIARIQFIFGSSTTLYQRVILCYMRDKIQESEGMWHEAVETSFKMVSVIFLKMQQ
jgi:hypothetical protein